MLRYLLIILSFSFYSCSDGAKKQSETPKAAQVNRVQDNVSMESIEQSGLSPKQDERTPTQDEQFEALAKLNASKLCQIYDDDRINPFVFEQLYAQDGWMRAVQTVTTQVQSYTKGCSEGELIWAYFPFALYKLKGKADSPIDVIELVKYQDNKIATWTTTYSLKTSQFESYVEQIETQDGTKLTTFVFDADAKVKKATVLLRTPYIKHSFGEMRNFFDLEPVRKYAIQAVRGTYTSEGDFRWLDGRDAQDAYDTIDALCAKESSNGNVVTMGVSYAGYTALAAGTKKHSCLKGIYAGSAPVDSTNDSFIKGNIPSSRLLSYLGDKPQNQEEIRLFGEKVDYLLALGTTADQLDNELFGKDLNEWDAIVSAALNQEADYWSKRGIFNKLKDIEVPVLLSAGLVDDQDSLDTFLTFEEFKKHSNHENKKVVYSNNGHTYPDKKHHEAAITAFSLGADVDDSTMPEDAKKVLFQNLGPVTYHSKKANDFKTSDTYPGPDHDMFELPLNKDTLNNVMGIDVGDSEIMGELKQNDENSRLIFGISVAEDLYVNGPMKFEIYVRLKSPKANLYISPFYTKGSESKYLNQVDGIRIRKSLDISDGEIQKIELWSYPTNKLIPKDSAMLITVRPALNSSFVLEDLAEEGVFEVLNSDEYPSKVLIPLDK